MFLVLEQPRVRSHASK